MLSITGRSPELQTNHYGGRLPASMAAVSQGARSPSENCSEKNRPPGAVALWGLAVEAGHPPIATILDLAITAPDRVLDVATVRHQADHILRESGSRPTHTCARR